VNGPVSEERAAALEVLRRLRAAGHVAYFAGGCVRDRLLGIEPKDHDVATDARPEAVRGLFPRARRVGEAFGVMLVRRRNFDIEVATFRREWGYRDGRRPETVVFTGAEEDARRRDFTVNGLFEDPLAETPAEAVIDYVGGRADLERRVLRAIGEPAARFGEDYLRMLRAVRLASRLEFTLEPATARAIAAGAGRLAEVARERVGQELAWMLTGARFLEAVQLAQRLGLDGPVLGEEAGDVPLRVLGRLGALRAGGRAAPDEATALAAWLLDRHLEFPGAGAGFAATRRAVERLAGGALAAHAGRWRRALALSGAVHGGLVGAIEGLAGLLGWEGLALHAQKRLLARPHAGRGLVLLEALADWPGVPAHAGRVGPAARRLLEAGVQPAPLVSGADLLALGMEPGPRVGRILRQAYDRQLDGELADRDAALAWVQGRLGGEGVG